MINKNKKGSVYTPSYLVEIILNQAGYFGEKILNKHIIDNSFGDGAFLTIIVERYIKEFFSYFKENLDTNLERNLEKYIHGIEIDPIEVEKTIAKLNKIAVNHNLYSINWDIIIGDSLTINKYNKKMDFVVGNPPYIRIHNLMNNYQKIKEFKFASQGMTDLFIVFYEIGINMLKNDGILVYINPSSLFNSKASLILRKFMIESKSLSSIINLKHFQAFDKATTYTTIIKLDFTKNHIENIVDYYEFDENKKAITFIDKLSPDDFFINDNFYLSTKNDLLWLKEILKTNIKNNKIQIKNGFATLADDVFINNHFDFKSSIIYNILKISNNTWKKCIFPYDENSNLIPFVNLDSSVQNYLFENKDLLSKRSLEKNSSWYAYGRSQAINDFKNDKIAINNLVRSKNDLKINKVNAYEGLYSGLYIISDIDMEIIKKIIINDDFIKFISLLGKYKAGGYYTFSSSDLKKYLLFKLKEPK